MQALFDTFRKILKNSCECSKECECTGDHCPCCKAKTLTSSKSEFMKFLNSAQCEIYKFAGRVYPGKSCIENKCASCELKNKYDLLDRFCVTAKENIDMNKKISTKIYVEKEKKNVT